MFYFALKSLKTNLQEISSKAGKFSLVGVTCINYHLTLSTGQLYRDAGLFIPKLSKDVFDH